MDEIAVVGCGAIGLPFAVALASRNLRVTGFDSDSAKIAQLTRGACDLVDDGLDRALRNALDAGTLRFVDRLDRERRGRTFVIAVPTPIDSSSRFDSGPLDAAIGAIENVARDDDLVILRSTTPVGTLRRYAARVGRSLAFAACPDRTLAGRAFVEQFTIPHLVGGLDENATARAADLLTKLGRVIRVATPEVAEAAKLFANVWRDAHFALANQLALFCEQAGLDYDEVRAAAGESFPRFNAARAGPVAGPCLTKDVYLLAGGEVPLLVEARRFNVRLVDKIADRLLRELAAMDGPARVAVLGLAFKGDPPTRDQRNSFGIALIERLKALRSDLAVVGWDPVCDGAAGAATALAGAAAVVLANDHPALADAALYSSCARGALLYDLCGVLRRTADLRPDIALRRFGRGKPA